MCYTRLMRTFQQCLAKELQPNLRPALSVRKDATQLMFVGLWWVIPSGTFSGMITCGAVESTTREWILDSGASDHMPCSLNLLHNIRPAPSHLNIKLPTGNTVNITHIGDTVHSQLIICH